MQKNLLVLIDTNVWVSAFINRNGYPAKAKEAFVNHEFDIAISPPLLQELGDPKLIEEMERYSVKVLPVSKFLDMLSQSA